ncbi:MAG: hypothetical protein M3P52_10750, partial [Actinomycetota bacterium]|nr:hypothetical protein [Actinomycetota bacterium]
MVVVPIVVDVTVVVDVVATGGSVVAAPVTTVDVASSADEPESLPAANAMAVVNPPTVSTAARPMASRRRDAHRDGEDVVAASTVVGVSPVAEKPGCE